MNEISIYKLTAYLESTLNATGEFVSKSRQESPDRWQKSKNEIKFAKYTGMRPTEAGGIILYFSVASSRYLSTGSTYTTLIHIPNILETFRQNPTYSTFTYALKNADVQVNCNCSDFKFRFEHWLNKSDSLFKTNHPDQDISIKQRPDVTNPNNDKGAFCKHLLKVAQVFLFNMSDYKKDLQKMLNSKVQTVNVPQAPITLQKNQFIDVVKQVSPELNASLAKDKGLTESDIGEITETLDKNLTQEENIENVELSKENVTNDVEISLEKDHIDNVETEVELSKDSEGEETSIELDKDNMDESNTRQV